MTCSYCLSIRSENHTIENKDVDLEHGMEFTEAFGVNLLFSLQIRRQVIKKCQ